MLNFCSESLVHTTPTLPQGVLTNLLTFLLTREFVRRFVPLPKSRGCWLPSRRPAASRAVRRAAGSHSISPTGNWPALLTGSCAPSLDPARRLGNGQVGIDEDPSLPGVGIALQDGGGAAERQDASTACGSRVLTCRKDRVPYTADSGILLLVTGPSHVPGRPTA